MHKYIYNLSRKHILYYFLLLNIFIFYLFIIIFILLYYGYVDYGLNSDYLSAQWELFFADFEEFRPSAERKLGNLLLQIRSYVKS